MTETRCEPPEHLRDRDGWHWVQGDKWPEPDDYPPELMLWLAHGEWFDSSGGIGILDGTRWRYLAPATPPDVVARLVEALEGLMHWHPAPNVIRRMGLKPEPAEAAYEAACAALAAYREAGR